jgi:hypothetical protein
MRELWDNDFDPFAAMQELQQNQQTLFNNQRILLERLQEQDQVIATLTSGLQAANSANEILLRDLQTMIEHTKQELTCQNHR